MPSAAGGIIDQSVGHSAFRILPTVPQPTSADFIPQIIFRISANYQHPRSHTSSNRARVRERVRVMVSDGLWCRLAVADRSD